MKSMMIAAAAFAATAGIAAAGTPVNLATWTYETSVPTTAGPHAAEGGLFAGAGSPSTGFHTSGATVYSNPVGNGSAESFSSNNWGLGDYYEFSTSTLGFQSIEIQWDQTSSNTGPRDFNLLWSTDGSTFTQIGGTLAVLANAAPNPVWTSGSSSAIYTFGPLSGPGALDNQASVFFRIEMASTVSANGGTVASAGTSRVDNVTISGVLIPTPGALALFGAAGLMSARRRRA